MANGQVSASERAKLENAMAQAELDAVLADTQTKMDLIKARRGAQMAYADSVRQAKEKAVKERQAQAEKAQKQAQTQSGSTEMLSDNLSTANVNAQGSTANVQQEELKFGGGNGPFAEGPEGPGAGGGAGMGLPGVPEAPPFLVSQRQQSEVGPHHFFPHMVAPARTTRRTTDIQPNVLSAAERQRALLANAKARIEQGRWEQEQAQRERNLVANTFLELYKEGVTGAAGAAAALQKGDVATAESLIGDQPTLHQKLQEARIRAADTSHRADLARIRNSNLETTLKMAQFLQMENQRDLLDAAGLPNFSGSPMPGSTKTFGGMKITDLISKMDNDILDKNGKTKPGREATAFAVQTEMFKNGVLYLMDYPTGEKSFYGLGPAKKGSVALSMARIVSDFDKWIDTTDPAAGKRLEETGLFEVTEGGGLNPAVTSGPNKEIVSGLYRLLVSRKAVEEKAGQPMNPLPEPLIEEVEEPAELREEEEEAAPFVGPTELYPQKLQGWEAVKERVRRAREAREEASRRWLERARR